MQDYKSPHITLMISGTVANRHKLTSFTISSVSRVKNLSLQAAIQKKPSNFTTARTIMYKR